MHALDLKFDRNRRMLASRVDRGEEAELRRIEAGEAVVATALAAAGAMAVREAVGGALARGRRNPYVKERLLCTYSWSCAACVRSSDKCTAGPTVQRLPPG
eukprot:3552930-Prymnesium_polylepis.1